MLIYFSQTGNTQLLAQAIKKNVENSDIIYVGFWTDKGNASKEALDYLKTLHHQKIFLFGTAGFGKSDNYFKKIIDKVKESIDESNGLRWFSFEDALKASTEPWFVENIYSKLNSKVKDYLKR